MARDKAENQVISGSQEKRVRKQEGRIRWGELVSPWVILGGELWALSLGVAKWR